MVKLNYDKWRAELDVAMQKKQAHKITELHIIRAQIRGKQHRQRARLDWSACSKLKKMPHEAALDLASNGGTAVVPLTFKDEGVLLGDAWKNYVLPTEAPKQHQVKEGFWAALKRIFNGVYRV